MICCLLRIGQSMLFHQLDKSTCDDHGHQIRVFSTLEKDSIVGDILLAKDGSKHVVLSAELR